jgi:hypothetical protein
VATDTPEVAELPVHPGLCAGCRHLRLLRSARSAFVFCAKSEQDARFPRYPRLPVVACDGFAPPPSGP